MLGDLFDPGPAAYGLRGDMHLWTDLARRFADVPIPPDAASLRQALRAGFEDLTGHAWNGDGPIVVAAYVPFGGMSAGHIDRRFWHGRAMELLEDRRVARMRNKG
ncbi:hypothetical protein OCGS_0550 [Oceaniovalibus guishaninsula JLT2003]|uniref:Uncharacterized protein n=1 Tax=Oceaniovalibus guishaninsula JLT2003 TaxID=1231392 RepID=K2I8X2_9RHOB|nr:hypothetical protein [Oceaniovalibus guishaninsula]EKE45460.1 hypothetical protein OCGS_0550 [Oceaniovalibus guishaninsula JLT2003]